MPTDIATLDRLLTQSRKWAPIVREWQRADFHDCMTEDIAEYGIDAMNAMPALLAVAEAARRFVTESYRPLLSDDAARFDVLRTALAALDAGVKP